jgi:hypothetical protein
MVATIVFPNCAPITIGELATVSYSVYREKNPVRTLSRISVKGFTKGSRTVAGTLIFTVFDKHFVNRIRSQVPYLNNLVRIKTDELPTFDIYITMGNEYGASARLNIYVITIVDEGKVMSVEDLFTENQWSYMARDIDLMDDLGAEQNKPLEEFRIADETNGAFKAESLVMDNTFEQMQKDLNSWRDAQKAKVAAERAAELKKYTYTVPDISYKKKLELVPDSGDAGDQVFKLTDEERAHVYDENHPEMKMTTRYMVDGYKGFKDAMDADSNTRSFIIWGVINDKPYDEATPILDGVTIGVSITFTGKDGEEVNDYLGNATFSDGNQHVVVDLTNFYAWTPTQPTINVFVGGHKTFEKGGVTYNLGSTDNYSFSDTWTGIQYCGEQYEIKFAWNEAGSSSEAVYENTSGYVIDFEIGAHNWGSGHETTIYRDGFFAQRGEDGKYKTTDWVMKTYVNSMSGWTLSDEAAKDWWNYFNPSKYTKTPYAYVNPDYFDPYFYIHITGATRNGEDVVDTDEFSSDLGFMTFLADIVVYADLGNGESIVADGKGANHNVFFPDNQGMYEGAIQVDNGGWFGSGDLRKAGKNLYVFKDFHLTGTNQVFQYMNNFWLALNTAKTSQESDISSLSAKIVNWRGKIQRSTQAVDPVPIKVNAPDLTIKVSVLDETNVNNFLK